jgi:hypothetical protein
VRPMDEHRKTAGADDLFLTFMVAGEIYSGLVISTTYKTFQFFSSHLILQGVDLVNDFIGVHIVHH